MKMEVWSLIQSHGSCSVPLNIFVVGTIVHPDPSAHKVDSAEGAVTKVEVTRVDVEGAATRVEGTATNFTPYNEEEELAFQVRGNVAGRVTRSVYIDTMKMAAFLLNRFTRCAALFSLL